MARLQTVERVTDVLTGEIVSERSTVVNIRTLEPEPPFIKMYIEDLGRLYQLKLGHQSILSCIASGVDYDGTIGITATRKAKIAAKLGCSMKSIENALTEYVRTGILVRIGRGEYELDPSLFAKGAWRDICERRKDFQAKITYSKTGRKIEMMPLDEPIQKAS